MICFLFVVNKEVLESILTSSTKLTRDQQKQSTFQRLWAPDPFFGAPQLDSVQDVKLKDFVHLLKGCLVPEPSERLAPEDALKHHFLRSRNPWISWMVSLVEGIEIDVEGWFICIHFWRMVMWVLSMFRLGMVWNPNDETSTLCGWVFLVQKNGDKLPSLDHSLPHRWVTTTFVGNERVAKERV